MRNIVLAFLLVLLGGCATVETRVSAFHELEQSLSEVTYEFNSPSALLSLGVVLISGFAGGYISALYASSRHLLQAAAAGAIGTTFFFAMSLGPSSQGIPSWYQATYVGAVLLSSLLGGQGACPNAG